MYLYVVFLISLNHILVLYSIIDFKVPGHMWKIIIKLKGFIKITNVLYALHEFYLHIISVAISHCSFVCSKVHLSISTLKSSRALKLSPLLCWVFISDICACFNMNKWTQLWWLGRRLVWHGNQEVATLIRFFFKVK